MNIDRLKENTKSEVFQGWIEAYKDRPWGNDWDQAALIACAAFNPHVKNGISAADVIPYAKQNVGITDLDEMERQFAAMCGG